MVVLQTILTRNIQRFCEGFLSLNYRQREGFIYHMSSSQCDKIRSCCFNVLLNSSIKIGDGDRAYLRRHNKLVKLLASRRVTLNDKRGLLAKKGAFLSRIVKIALDYIVQQTQPRPEEMESNTNEEISEIGNMVTSHESPENKTTVENSEKVEKRNPVENSQAQEGNGEEGVKQAENQDPHTNIPCNEGSDVTPNLQPLNCDVGEKGDTQNPPVKDSPYLQEHAMKTNPEERAKGSSSSDPIKQAKCNIPQSVAVIDLTQDDTDDEEASVGCDNDDASTDSSTSSEESIDVTHSQSEDEGYGSATKPIEC